MEQGKLSGCSVALLVFFFCFFFASDVNNSCDFQMKAFEAEATDLETEMLERESSCITPNPSNHCQVNKRARSSG